MVLTALRGAAGTLDRFGKKRPVIIRIVWKLASYPVARCASQSRRKATGYRRRNHPISLNKGVTDTRYLLPSLPTVLLTTPQSKKEKLIVSGPPFWGTDNNTQIAITRGDEKSNQTKVCSDGNGLQNFV